MYKTLCTLALMVILNSPALLAREFKMDTFGVKPGAKNISAKVVKALEKIRKSSHEGEAITISFLPGRYDFYPEGANAPAYYVSNHDQTESKVTGIVIEDMNGVRINGNGAEFVFHGVMLPIALVRSENCTLENFSVNFENPHIAQVEIIRNDGDGGMIFKPSPEVRYRIAENGKMETYGEGWSLQPWYGIAFDGKTGHILQNTGDILCNTENIRTLENGMLHAPEWKDARIVPGSFVAMRTGDRPAPGIFLSNNKNVCIKNVTVHYAYGMGLLAQLCDGITLDGFKVTASKGRYFTTQADATHFSQCKGLINSQNGIYEGMMDDAINIHGIYLQITEIIDTHTIKAEYKHDQAWGFDWGFIGDSVQFIRPSTMELADGMCKIESIRPSDSPTSCGAKAFSIRFTEPISGEKSLGISVGMGIENLSWIPEVIFSGNTVRNNRARGALFSSPLRTVVENNIFDHTSGSAILLCGDCNGWFESGACKDIIIRRNTFINALTSQYQFTRAVISIYPEIPDLKHQTQYFHGGKKDAITIIDNEFHTFGTPLLYAKSTDGIIFKDNKIITNTDFCRPASQEGAIILEKTGKVEVNTY